MTVTIHKRGVKQFRNEMAKLYLSLGIARAT